MNYDLYKIANPLGSVIDTKMRIQETLKYASRSSISNSINNFVGISKIVSDWSISNQLSDISNIIRNATIQNSNEIVKIMQGYSAVSFSNMSEVLKIVGELSYTSQINNISSALRLLSTEALNLANINKNIMSNYIDSIKNITQNIEIPRVTINEMLSNFNFDDVIDKKELDIAEDEKEKLIEDAKTSVTEAFSDVGEVNIFDVTEQQSINIEQKINKFCNQKKLEHPVLVDMTSKIYSKLFDKLLEYLIPIILTCIISNFNAIGAKTAQIFGKVKDVSNKFTISDAVKEVRNITNKECLIIKNEVYKRYRYINKDEVNIRENHKIDSYITKKIGKGDIVEVKINDEGKKIRYKNWIYVKYEDDDGNMYEGWLNNAYTKRIE